MQKVKFQKEAKFSHKTENRNSEMVNWMLKITPGVREALLKQDRVYIATFTSIQYNVVTSADYAQSSHRKVG